jgi:hypothetical protein
MSQQPLPFASPQFGGMPSQVHHPQGPHGGVAAAPPAGGFYFPVPPPPYPNAYNPLPNPINQYSYHPNPTPQSAPSHHGVTAASSSQHGGPPARDFAGQYTSPASATSMTQPFGATVQHHQFGATTPGSPNGVAQNYYAPHFGTPSQQVFPANSHFNNVHGANATTNQHGLATPGRDANSTQQQWYHNAGNVGSAQQGSMPVQGVNQLYAKQPFANSGFSPMRLVNGQYATAGAPNAVASMPMATAPDPVPSGKSYNDALMSGCFATC